MKELAAKILELNSFRTRTEQLDNELKTYNNLKHEKRFDDNQFVDYAGITKKTDVYYTVYPVLNKNCSI
jgi:hypothetical protein